MWPSPAIKIRWAGDLGPRLVRGSAVAAYRARLDPGIPGAALAATAEFLLDSRLVEAAELLGHVTAPQRGGPCQCGPDFVGEPPPALAPFLAGRLSARATAAAGFSVIRGLIRSHAGLIGRIGLRL